ncbi:7-deoxyloganetin glucosyltransferase-like [Typha latifolia]|uniref:7-deoxyloganetin glucosyltransferase-like n=1 Tax=Typha latifolia TaxID=4733 RepID=UPI003C2B2917
MSSMATQRPHAVIFPYPATSQVIPMLKMAKLLHSKGFVITFINSDYNQQRILNTEGDDALKGSDTFQFKSIPDGLSASEHESPEYYFELMPSVQKTCPAPLADLLALLRDSSGGDGVPPVTCVIYNFLTPFALDVAENLGVPSWVFCSASASYFNGCLHLDELMQRGYIPLKDESCLTNGYLDTLVDFIPGMKGIPLRYLSSFVRTTDPDDLLVNGELKSVQKATCARGLILNTFDHLENEVMDPLKEVVPRLYNVGPLGMLLSQMEEDNMKETSLNMFKEDPDSVQWLNTQRDASVIYVSFGSIIAITDQELIEFAWGLAESNHPFLWIIRPGLVHGGMSALPDGFIKATKDRSFLAGWCPQEEVLSHPSVGAFVTHNGWNSMVEAIGGGVPMICWPRLADEFSNCYYACQKWGIGVEMEENVKREQVRELIKVVMEGESGEKMRENAKKWKRMAEAATMPGGSSYANLEGLIKDLISDGL